MKKIWIIAFFVALIGGVALFEYWTNLQFPLVQFEPSPLPELNIGRKMTYTYSLGGETLGNHSFWIESKGRYSREGDFKGHDAYFTRSFTSVTKNGDKAEIESIYVLSVDFEPIEYKINASLGGELQSITCIFDKESVTGQLEMGDTFFEENTTIPENTVLIDNMMVGHWYLLFNAFILEPGNRVRITAYVPQMLGLLDFDLVAEKKHTTIQWDEDSIEVRVISASRFNLDFYIYNREIVIMKETQQDITLTLNSER